jgi:hypothetical protein
MQPTQVLEAECTCEQRRWQEKRKQACAHKVAIVNGHLNILALQFPSLS